MLRFQIGDDGDGLDERRSGDSRASVIHGVFLRLGRRGASRIRRDLTRRRTCGQGSVDRPVAVLAAPFSAAILTAHIDRDFGRMAEARKPAAFVHLRVKSAYSLLEGAIRPKELAELARDNAMPAVGRHRRQQSVRRLSRSARRWRKRACSPSSAACSRSIWTRRAAPGAMHARDAAAICRCWCRTRSATAISRSF